MNIFVNGITQVIQNIGLIVASVTAFYGINAWRREFKGKKQYELAEEVLSLLLQCRDHLRAIRSPFSHKGEGSTRKANPNESPKEKELLDRAYTVFERYEQRKETFVKLFTLRYRFMALFGKEAAAPIEDFRLALNEVFVSAEMLPGYWDRQGGHFKSEEDFKQHLDEMSKCQSVFWGTLTEKDHFDRKVEGIVAQIDSTCARVLRREGFWFSIRHWS